MGSSSAPARRSGPVRSACRSCNSPRNAGDFYPNHDHADTGTEEVYVVFGGEADFEIEGERVARWAETVIRVGARTHRKILPGPEGVRILAIGGLRGGVYSPPPFTELGGPDPVPDPSRIA